MMALAFFGWWYGVGWRQVVRNVGLRLIKTSHMFSVPILLRTLFAPWRRIMTYPGAGLSERVRALGDNLVSRAVGFTVRVFVLATVGLLLLLVAIAGIIEVVVWPVVPLGVVVAIVKGII
jgi:hypothetical protein